MTQSTEYHVAWSRITTRLCSERQQCVGLRVDLQLSHRRRLCPLPNFWVCITSEYYDRIPHVYSVVDKTPYCSIAVAFVHFLMSLHTCYDVLHHALAVQLFLIIFHDQDGYRLVFKRAPMYQIVATTN